MLTWRWRKMLLGALASAAALVLAAPAWPHAGALPLDVVPPSPAAGESSQAKAIGAPWSLLQSTNLALR